MNDRGCENITPPCFVRGQGEVLTEEFPVCQFSTKCKQSFFFVFKCWEKWYNGLVDFRSFFLMLYQYRREFGWTYWL